jgi:hypothetical protein
MRGPPGKASGWLPPTSSVGDCPMNERERERRIGLNEAVFRQTNERIEELNQTFATFTDRLLLVCECGDGACAEKISMSPAEYEELRSEASHFAIVPGHEIPDVEKVVAHREGYDVVSKHQGIPRQIAEVTDPR